MNNFNDPRFLRLPIHKKALKSLVKYVILFTSSNLSLKS